MINFFGTNRVVPNGYIYTSHKGSEYIYFEGIWFNHKNMKMIDPNKAPQMNEAAKKQIIEHNCNNKQMIGETFTFTGKTYTYVGKERFTENGVLTESKVLTELLADEERVYSVSRDTLNKEWNELKFSIIPPHAEDISIPPGLVVNGFKFIPRGQRFQDMSTGSYAEPAMARKLYDAGIRMVRADAGNHTLVPINSTLMTGNSKLQYNGTDFCDNDGNPVVSGASADKIISAYTKFVQSNPQDFPSLVGDNTKEQRFGANVRPKVGSDLVQKRDQVTEAITSNDFSNFKAANPEKIEIPSGFKVGDYTYRKKQNVWQNNGEAVSDKTFNKELNTDAINKIKEMNKDSDYPINSTIDYRGNKLTWNGLAWVSEQGKRFQSSDFMNEVDRFVKSSPKSAGTSSEEKIEGAEQGLVVGKTKITDKNGKVFIYQGGEDFVNPDDESLLPSDIAKATVQRVSGASKGKETNPEAEAEVSSTEVPDGFAITSKAGVKYIKKAGQWISSQTKKAMNSSAAKSIERAAESKIKQHNETSPVKIGDTWKSAKGKEYKYVGDDRFISTDGKLVPKSSAEKIMSQLSAKGSEEKPEVPQDSTQSADVEGFVVGKTKIKDKAGKQYVYQGGNKFVNPDDDSVYPTELADKQIEKFKQSQAGNVQTTAADQGEPVQAKPQQPEAGAQEQPSGNSDLEALAQQIKAHPKARKITVLMTRGDKVSLLAADLILAGKEQDAIKILKALNSSDE